jgi:hypothetical protein
MPRCAGTLSCNIFTGKEMYELKKKKEIISPAVEFEKLGWRLSGLLRSGGSGGQMTDKPQVGK